MTEDLSNLNPRGVLDAAMEVLVARRLTEVKELELLAQWAAIHSEEDKGKGALIEVGGEGTPKVQTFCLGEIAIARETSIPTTGLALADVLDLQHRLRKTWAVVKTGRVEGWIARRVAKMTRHLPLEKVGLVDRAVARMLGHESAGRILGVAEAKIIEADPDAHNARVEEERKRRYARLGRRDEYGLQTLIARIETADAVWLDATLARVAEILRPLHEDATTGELRAMAMGYLARPAELLVLLAEAAVNDEATTGAPADGENSADDTHGPGTHLTRALAYPVELLDRLRDIDWSKLAPKAVLYLHLHEAALGGTERVAGAVRGENGLGPHTLDQLHQMLKGTKVTVKPVIDLKDRVRTTAYEHPEAIKERVYLMTGGDYFPYASSTSRHVDYDHVRAFVKEVLREATADANAPPAGEPQTGTDNCGPLGRHNHILKTFAGYQVCQIGPATYLWITPNGLVYLVDPSGTTRIDL